MMINPTKAELLVSLSKFTPRERRHLKLIHEAYKDTPQISDAEKRVILRYFGKALEKIKGEKHLEIDIEYLKSKLGNLRSLIINDV